MPNTMIHVRMDEETKQKAASALEAMGLTVSEAVRIFMHRVASEQAIPFPLKVPNIVTRAAMEEARAMGAARCATPEALFDALGSEKE